MAREERGYMEQVVFQKNRFKMDRYKTKKVMASILVVYLHIISPYIRRFKKILPS